MQVEQIDLDAIRIGERHRPVDPDKVAELAKSMSDIGLRTPISVWAENSAIHLVAGLHRVEAAKSLGWSKIDCFILDDMDELKREMWELDENFCRSELTSAEIGRHYHRRRDLWAKIKERDSGTACPTLTGRGNKAFAAETAEKTGKSKRTISRALRRADRLGLEVLKEVTRTPLDNGADLDRLAELPPEDRKAAIKSGRLPEPVATAVAEVVEPAVAAPGVVEAAPAALPVEGASIFDLFSRNMGVIWSDELDSDGRPIPDLEHGEKRLFAAAEALVDLADCFHFGGAPDVEKAIMNTIGFPKITCGHVTAAVAAANLSNAEKKQMAKASGWGKAGWTSKDWINRVESLSRQLPEDYLGPSEIRTFLPLLKRLGLWTYPAQTRKPAFNEPKIDPEVEDQVDAPPAEGGHPEGVRREVGGR